MLSSSVFGARLTTEDLANLPTKTVNGQKIVGVDGDIEVVDAATYRAVADVSLHGAVGDGRTDDTAAIMAAYAEAVEKGIPLYFPRRGGNYTYLTRKGIVLVSGMTLTSDPGVVLASASAVLEGGGQTITRVLTQAAAQHATSCTVDSVAGLVVGQEITICVNNPGGYSETLADITAIDPETKTVSFSAARFSADGETNTGMMNAVGAGGVLMTDFALVKTIYQRHAVNVTVENLTLRPYGNPSDEYVYTLSPIHQTAQGRPSSQNTFCVRNVTIDGSTHDGISAQGSGDIWVENCTVRNVKHKGIHWGTSCDKVIVRNNWVENCGSPAFEAVSNNKGTGAMYFCVNNHRVIIEGNLMKNCYKGVFGFDNRGTGESDYAPVIENNVFDNCTLCGVKLEAGWAPNLRNNIFKNFTGTAIPVWIAAEGSARHQGFSVTDNVLSFADGYSNTNGAIYVEYGTGCLVNGNRLLANANATGNQGIRVRETKKSVIVGNTLAGGRVELVGENNEDVVTANNTEKEAL